ncbi:protein PIN-LIKES 1-like [Silene latifolia]|uniref:protein PIN-LIKES 1-like n=1 Tax=Silene latifolia TaxID=37657 RepID=UPI003D76C13B
MVGSSAPLRVGYSTAEILGGAIVPCVTLIVGANLLRGLRRSGVSGLIIIGVIVVCYIALPLLGIVIVRTAHHFGMVGNNPQYQFVLMLQFALPPAMTIGTISQLLCESVNTLCWASAASASTTHNSTILSALGQALTDLLLSSFPKGLVLLYFLDTYKDNLPSLFYRCGTLVCTLTPTL